MIDDDIWRFGETLLAEIRSNLKNALCEPEFYSQGAKFLNKLWCCVGKEYNKIIWFYRQSSDVNWPL